MNQLVNENRSWKQLLESLEFFIRIPPLLIKSTMTAGKEIRKSLAQAVKTTFTAPKQGTLYWSGKPVPDFKMKEKKYKLEIHHNEIMYTSYF